MYEQGVVMCALCSAIETSHGFIDLDLKQTEWLNSHPNMPILYDVCPQCQTRLQTGRLVVHQTHSIQSRA